MPVNAMPTQLALLGLLSLTVLAPTALAQLDEESPAAEQADRATAMSSLGLGLPAEYDQAMQRLVDFEFEQPLSPAQLESMISLQAGLPVWVEKAEIARSGGTCHMPQSANIHGMPLHQALEELLGPCGLGWSVYGEMIVITMAQEAANDLIVRVYPVRDLVATTEEGLPLARTLDEDDYQKLLQQVAAETDLFTEPWEYRFLTAQPTVGTVTIAQTHAGHLQIEQLLATWRAARVAALAAGYAEEMDIRVYRLTPPPGVADEAAWKQNMIATMEEMIDPASWQAAGGEGWQRTISGMLYVRQTRAAHMLLETLLSGT